MMDVRQEEIDQLLLDPSFRNWALNANNEDYNKWESYLLGDKELTKIAKEAKKIIVFVETSDDHQSPSSIESFERLKEKLKQGDNVRPITPSVIKGKKVLRYHTLIKVAAVISFLIVFSGILYFNYENNESGTQLVEQTIQKHTQSGQHLTITLPDGSKVKLNSNSSISYPREFFKNRKVELSGEAFFEVVRDESSPFLVKTETFQTEVLGTSFNVNVYDKNSAKVSVSEGTVKVSSLADNQIVDYKIVEKENAVKISEEKVESATFYKDEILWADGILVFTNENIHTISAKLERWFNVEVSVANDSDIKGGFSGKYSNESLNEILKGMGYEMNFTFEMKGNEIFIVGTK